MSVAAHKLQAIVVDLLYDWGAFLDTDLYKEAVCDLYNTESSIIQPVEISIGLTFLEKQNLPIISPQETFCISSIRNGTSTYRTHLQRFLKHTALKQLHWINTNNLNIEFETLTN